MAINRVKVASSCSFETVTEPGLVLIAAMTSWADILLGYPTRLLLAFHTKAGGIDLI
jgi:hypothetical protein